MIHQVEKHPRNPLIVPEHSWELRYNYGWDGGQVLYDREQEIFKMWWTTGTLRSLYATSKDGIEWEKPKLGLVEFDGSKENNIFLLGSNPSVIYEPNDPHPERRYKMQLNHALVPGTETEWVTYPVYTSPDGIRWTQVLGAPVTGGDDNSTAFYDKASRRYVSVFKRALRMNFRIPERGQPTKGEIECAACGKLFVPERRTLGISFSDDFLNWTPVQTLLLPDDLDDQMARERAPALCTHYYALLDKGYVSAEDKKQWELKRKQAEAAFGILDRLEFPPVPDYQRVEYYNMIVLPYEDLYVGLVWRFTVTAPCPYFYPFLPSEYHGGQDGVIETQLVSSRNLLEWQKCGDRRPIIPLGKAGEWDCSMVFCFNAPLIRDDEIWFYYGGSDFSHAARPSWDRRIDTTGKGKQAIGLANLRLDGFVSVEAGEQEGELTTKLLTFRGEKLIVNASATQGTIAVEVLDASGQPVNGFEREKCEVFSGDEIRHTVNWRGGPNVKRLNGTPVRLRFHLRKANLYAFQFTT
jgi:hypothetical protein